MVQKISDNAVKGILDDERAEALPILPVPGHQHAGLGAQRGFEDEGIPPLQAVLAGKFGYRQHAPGGYRNQCNT